MSLRFALPAAMALAALPAAAQALDVRVQDQDGAPLSGAVVQLYPADGGTAPAPPAHDHVIDQSDEQFVPLVTLARPGDRVAFSNSDTTLHHVYSFSPLAAFEMTVASGETSDAVRYAQPGVAAIGCNIHDDMIAYVVVAGAPFAALTGADGRARIDGAGAGGYRVEIWHPRGTGAERSRSQDVTLQAGQDSLTLGMEVSPERDGRHSHGSRY